MKMIEHERAFMKKITSPNNISEVIILAFLKRKPFENENFFFTDRSQYQYVLSNVSLHLRHYLKQSTKEARLPDYKSDSCTAFYIGKECVDKFCLAYRESYAPNSDT